MKSAFGPCTADGTSDAAMLASILWTSKSTNWDNLNLSWHRIKPRFSVLGVDMWNRDASTSARAARAAVHAEYASVLHLFDRVIFFATGNKTGVSHSSKPCFTYRRLWRATFGAGHREWAGAGYGIHQDLFGEGLPRLLIGMDADRVVPDMLPLEEIAELLERSWQARHTRTKSEDEPRRSWLRARARSIWLVGRRTVPCLADSFAESMAAAPVAAEPFDQGEWFISPDARKGCAPPSPQAHPVFVVPAKGLWGEDQLCDFPAAYQMPPGASGGCHTTNFSQEALEPLFNGMPRAFGPGQLGRGPYCPSSQLWIAHRNDLDLVLASFELWADAFVANKWEPNVVRWESTTCSLLSPREAVLWLRFPWLHDRKPPSQWVSACVGRCKGPECPRALDAGSIPRLRTRPRDNMRLACRQQGDRHVCTRTVKTQMPG